MTAVTPRREFAATACVCGAGAGLILVASGQPWVHVIVNLPNPLPDGKYALTGSELAPLIAALGLAGLAGLAGMVATRGYARMVVGAILAIFGGAVIYASLTGNGAAAVHQALADEAVLSDGALRTSWTVWWVVSISGGVLLVAAGVLTVLAVAAGRRWPGLSSKYDAPRRVGRPRSNEPRDRAGPASRSGEGQGSEDTARPGSDRGGDMWETLDHGHDPTA